VSEDGVKSLCGTHQSVRLAPDSHTRYEEVEEMAYIVAIHDVSDPDSFWGAAGSLELPADVKIVSTYPRADGSRAVCLWEADSVDKVRGIVDGAAGDISNNEFFEVDPGHAATTGLPVSSTTGS